MTRCFLAETAEDRLKDGAMWFGPYEEPGRKVEGWYVRLPGGRVWHTRQRAWDGKDYGAEWTVTGEPPNITVQPSINCEPDWHGHITNGEMTP
jgi:hypothetical protein